MARKSPDEHQSDNPNPQDPQPPQNSGQSPLPVLPPGQFRQVQPQPQQVQQPAYQYQVNFPPPPQEQQFQAIPTYRPTEPPYPQPQQQLTAEAQAKVGPAPAPAPVHPLDGQGFTQYIYGTKENVVVTPAPNYQHQVPPPPAPQQEPSPNYAYTPAKGQAGTAPGPGQTPYIYQTQPNAGTTAAPVYHPPVYVQPNAYPNQPGTYVVQHQTVAVIPGLHVGSQTWTTDLFDCMDDPNSALITCCLPCITVGQIAEILDNGSTTCATAGMIYSAIACCTGMQYLYSCGYRTKLRRKFNLVESPGPDIIIHCLCECCALSQEYRELAKRGFDPALGWNGVVAAQQQQQGVTAMAAPSPQMMMMQ